MSHTTMKQGIKNLAKVRKENSDKRAKSLKKGDASKEVSQEKIDELRVKELLTKKTAKTITADELKELAKLQGKK